MSVRAELSDRVLSMLLATMLDLAFGEPDARLHPVVWLGGVIDVLERWAPIDDSKRALGFGTAAALGLPALAACGSIAADLPAARLPRAARIIVWALLLKPSFSLRALLQAGTTVRRALAAGDLQHARSSLQALVSRDTTCLTDEECAGAAIESLAENTTDSFIGPWLAFMCFGLPGAWAFRAVNTLDSRWGYHGHYEWLGRTAALLDDACAALPSRLSAMLLIASARLTGGRARAGLRGMLDSRKTTGSPNSGWTMGAVAGALNLRLSKPGSYELNATGSAASATDISSAQRLVETCASLALAAALGAALLCDCSGFLQRFGKRG
jgi:adenosylcobinamide-phosphate synthase